MDNLVMDKDEQVVFSAGNSWIVCRSKSHSGRIYYFNTLTGEAAWNLSSAEIEKAKTRTNSLSKQAKINIEACPEPKEPPIDQKKEMSGNHQDSPSSSTIYNKQIINNRFSKPSYPMAPVMIPPYNHLVANRLNNLMPLALNSQMPGFNPHVWAVPPTHQIFIGPTISPLVNQEPSTSVNIAYGNQKHTVIEQNTSISLSERFRNLHTRGFNSTPQKNYQQRSKFTPRSNKRFTERNHYNNQKSFKKNSVVQDLRQVLSAKKKERRASLSAECEVDRECKIENNADLMDDNLSGYTSGSEVNINYEEGHKEKDDENKTDSDWIEDHFLIEDSRLKLDISNLKKMARPEMDLDCWYIVADKDILLYHLYFLNTLCNSDDSCCLMVAQQVLAELSELSRGSCAAGAARRARRAVSFLHKQLDEGYVVIGDGACEENGTRCDYLLNCCSNLLEDNFHVILLSNDEEFQSYKDSTNIPIFNIKEIKQFITHSELDSQQFHTKQTSKSKTPQVIKTDRLKPPPCMTETMLQKPKGPIKITVTNDLVKTNDKNSNACDVDEETQCNGDGVTVDQCNKNVLEKNEHDNDYHNSVTSVKHTIEAAVQTDTQIENEPSVSNEPSVPNEPSAPNEASAPNEPSVPNPDYKFTQTYRTEERETSLKQEKEKNKNAMPAVTPRKEIRLNRSISVKTTTSSEDADAERKQFKWRRRRKASKITKDSKISSLNSSNVDDNGRDSVNAQKDVLIEQQTPQKKSEESICSETSSLIITRNQFNDSIIVEETSTSGIISNSTIDSESESGNKLSSSMLLKKIEPSKTVMYEITDQDMEDSLRIMNDEWISRFTQIMEEVLTQVLRKDLRFLVDVVYKLHGGGPWTIWEAAECIKIKYSNDCDIVDAATKLINIFKKIRDHTGRITLNLEPSAYMEMYSFGVYLVRSLQRVWLGCEDVGGAARALRALLDDIRSPDRDAGRHDAFVDHNPTDALTNTSPPKQTVQKSTDEPVDPEKPINKVAKSKGAAEPNSPRNVGETSYNLRSRKKSQEVQQQENKKEENVTFIRKFNIEDSFFDSLNLVKKPVVTSSAVTKLIASPQPVSNDTEVASSSQGLIRSIFDRNLDDSSQECYKNTSGTEAKVIRKFTVFPEYEKTLKGTVVREPLDMDQLDYSAMFDEDENFMNAEYYSNNENYANGHDSQDNEEHATVANDHGHNDDALCVDHPVIQTNEENKNGNDKQFMCDSPLNMNKKLNIIFSTIISRVKEALMDVEKFCKETYKELSGSRVQSLKRKYEINESAVKTQVLLDNLCKSLNGILHRETYDTENNIQSLLKKEGINDFNLDDNQLNLYRTVIGKCIEQAEILKNSVTLIISVIKKQPIE